MAYYLIGSRRRIALINIKACFPEFSDKQAEQVNKAHFSYVGQSVFTVPANMWISERRFRSRVQVDGVEHLDQALAEKRNIIFLAPHFIGLDVGGFAIATVLQQEGLAMYQYAKNALMDEIIKRGRSRFGTQLIERKAPLRRLMKAVKKGMPFYYLPDQDAGQKGVFVPFFHSLASTIPALGQFAKISNSVVIPVMTEVKPKGAGYRVTLGKPLKGFPSGDDIVDTTRMNQAIEQMVRSLPEQYLWVHKRFKTRPEGEPKFY